MPNTLHIEKEMGKSCITLRKLLKSIFNIGILDMSPENTVLGSRKGLWLLGRGIGLKMMPAVIYPLDNSLFTQPNLLIRNFSYCNQVCTSSWEAAGKREIFLEQRSRKELPCCEYKSNL